MVRPFYALSFVFALVEVVSGCRCDRGLNRTGPVLVVDKTTVDWGSVQINLVHPAKFHVINDGTSSLTLSEPTIGSPFALVTELPITFPIGAEGDIELTYSPTVANQLNEGELVFRTDDAENVTKTIKLRGQGVQAVAAVTPSPIAFGDVYAKESKPIVVKLTNSGTNELTVRGVLFIPGSTPTITGNLAPLKVNVPAGGSVQATITFAPQDISDVTGGLRFELDPLQGGRLDVPFTGRGIRAIPVACFRFNGTATELCSDPNATSLATITIPFGSLCDNRLFPPGSTNGCTTVNGEKTGTLYLRNDGNVPVQFSATWEPNAAGDKNPCDAGTTPTPDFQFSNAPDAGLVLFNTATVQTPGSVTDPRPWETQPVSVTYRPTSRCSGDTKFDTADQARVRFDRQGEPFGSVNRTPTQIFVFMSGNSSLPNAQPANVNITANRNQLPRAIPFVGVINQGTAPVSLTAFAFFEELTDAGVGTGPNGGVLVSCTGRPATSPCARFAWAANGDPNANVPITLGPKDGGSTPAIGSVLFGPDGGYAADGGIDCTFGVCPAQAYRIYAITDTTDPYHPKVVSEIQATATN